MSRASAAQPLLPFDDQPEEMGHWDGVLTEAFADPPLDFWTTPIGPLFWRVKLPGSPGKQREING